MDVVREGPEEAQSLLIVSSACHGVEGYCGSGVQVQALQDSAWREAARASKVAVLYIHALNPYGFSHVRREPMTLAVLDSRTKAPVTGAEVYGATFLYLPQPGVEADWGFPPLQTSKTDAAGKAVVDQVSGFRNRVTVRLAGYQDAVVAFDGRAIAGPRSVDVAFRKLQFKQVDFLVVDAKSKAPVAGAEVRLGESRDGLPPNPNGWTKVVGANGRTGPMPVPDLEPFLVSVTSSNYKEWRGAPVWRSLDDGQTKKLELERK